MEGPKGIATVKSQYLCEKDFGQITYFGLRSQPRSGPRHESSCGGQCPYSKPSTSQNDGEPVPYIGQRRRHVVVSW